MVAECALALADWWTRQWVKLCATDPVSAHELSTRPLVYGTDAIVKTILGDGHSFPSIGTGKTRLYEMVIKLFEGPEHVRLLILL